MHASWVPRQLGARVQVDAELALVDSGLPCDTFNFICRARLTPSTAAQRVREAIAFFAVTGHPFSWWLGPGASPADLPALLGDAGLERAETESAMSLDLAALPSALPTIDRFTVARVRTPRDLAAFAALSAANWDPPDQWVIAFYQRAAATLLSDASPQWLYLGTLDGQPVATAELTVGGGVVGLYNISTHSSCRGRGIGTAMTVAPLLDAHQAGWTTAILQAADAGVGVYRRLGFTVFGQITEFKPSS